MADRWLMGLGHAITLDGLINTRGRRELCFRPLYPALEAGLCIVWKKYQLFSRAAEQFLKQLQFQFAPKP